MNSLAKVILATVLLAISAGTLLLFAQPQTEGTTMPATTAPATRPSLSDIQFKGFGITQDSVVLALQAAGRAFGKSSDYDALYCLSGSAFAPAIDTGEDCCSWWHVKAPMGAHNLPLMASSIGLNATIVATPRLPANATEEDHAAFLRDATPKIRQAMFDGAIVITEGGWDEVGAWSWAGIVTTIADHDGSIRGMTLSGATLDGKKDVLLQHASRIWAIRPADAAPPQQFTRQMLETAVRRIRGQGEYAASGNLLYGIDAMDRWIKQMRDVRGFCGPCFSRVPVTGVQDAPDNDRRMYQAARTVSRHLNSIKDSLPADQQPWIAKAAGCYDHIAQLLAPSDNGQFNYDSLSSLDAQRQYARDVLDPIKADLTWAAAHLERALFLAQGGTLLPSVIAPYDEIAREYPDMNPVRSDLLMRLVCLKTAGVSDITYDDLVMLAGFGTTFAYHPKQFFLAYEWPDNPQVTEDRLQQGTGVAFEPRTKTDSPEEAFQFIKRAIDAGRPVQASWFDDFIIAGYLDAPQPTNRQLYTLGKWSIAERMNWAGFTQWHQSFGRLTCVSPRQVTRQDLSHELLAKIVDWGANDNRQLVDFMKDGKFSFDGMEAFAADIADPTKPPDYFDSAWLACHAINRQWSSRSSAARWLGHLSQTQGDEAAGHLEQAASLYARSYELWRQFRTTLTPEAGQDLSEKWKNQEARKLGAELLREAIENERRAIEEIGLALPLAK